MGNQISDEIFYFYMKNVLCFQVHKISFYLDFLAGFLFSHFPANKTKLKTFTRNSTTTNFISNHITNVIKHLIVISYPFYLSWLTVQNFMAMFNEKETNKMMTVI